MINVTKTFFPPIQSYISQLEKIWTNEWLTNRGELVLELEKELMRYLEVEYMIIMNNGTIPLQIALKLFGRNGEIITTPFSYVATSSSIVWENCIPVFVDIEPDYLTINPEKIEAAITENTTCILATHVFGNPCDVEAIGIIARKYGLTVIYDAAHCFGVRFNGMSIFKFGDISTCSFHATKLFHTGEGGALFCNQAEIYSKAFYSHNFGHNGPLEFHGLGINGKISELHAAMGLSVLPFMEEIVQSRKKIVETYLHYLDFAKLKTMTIRPGTEWNYSYFPIIVESEEKLLKIELMLMRVGIKARRYFYPSLNKLPYVNYVKMNESEDISPKILCLPLFDSLELAKAREIAGIVNMYSV
jgi:dTDP-4-amino-4,6-dideoxygalactose transaminase